MKTEADTGGLDHRMLSGAGSKTWERRRADSPQKSGSKLNEADTLPRDFWPLDMFVNKALLQSATKYVMACSGGHRNKHYTLSRLLLGELACRHAQAPGQPLTPRPHTLHIQTLVQNSVRHQIVHLGENRFCLFCAQMYPNTQNRIWHQNHSGTRTGSSRVDLFHLSTPGYRSIFPPQTHSPV